jgi:hypothetical protein
MNPFNYNSNITSNYNIQSHKYNSNLDYATNKIEQKNSNFSQSMREMFYPPQGISSSLYN